MLMGQKHCDCLSASPCDSRMIVMYVAFDFTHLIECIYYASHGEIRKKKSVKIAFFHQPQYPLPVRHRHIKAIQITQMCFYTYSSSNYMSLDTPNSQKPHQPLVFFQPCENDVFPQSAAVLLTVGGNPFLERSIPGTEKRRGEGEAVATQCWGYTIHTGLSGSNWGVTPALSEARGTACPCPASLHTTVPQCATGYVQDRGWKKTRWRPLQVTVVDLRDFISVGPDLQISNKTVVLHEMH